MKAIRDSRNEGELRDTLAEAEGSYRANEALIVEVDKAFSKDSNLGGEIQSGGEW